MPTTVIDIIKKFLLTLPAGTVKAASQIIDGHTPIIVSLAPSYFVAFLATQRFAV